MKESVLFIFVVVAALTEATNRFGIYRDINSVLECDVPFWTTEGDFGVPADIPVLRLQPNLSSVVWRPLGSRRQVPYGTPNAEILLNFLGDDFDEEYSSIGQPGDLPAIRVSKTLSVQDVLPENEFFSDVDNNTMETVLNWADTLMLGICPLDSEWIKLDRSFFPRWYAGTFCSSRDCSVPRTLGCHPEMSEDNPPNTVTVLHWDCCHSFNSDWNNYLYNCGWRKVKIPIISFCTCACGPKLESIRL